MTSWVTRSLADAEVARMQAVACCWNAKLYIFPYPTSEFLHRIQDHRTLRSGSASACRYSQDLSCHVPISTIYCTMRPQCNVTDRRTDGCHTHNISPADMHILRVALEMVASHRVRWMSEWVTRHGVESTTMMMQISRLRLLQLVALWRGTMRWGRDRSRTSRRSRRGRRLATNEV